MNTLMSLGGGVFEWIVQTTWQATVLAGLILLTQWLLGKRLSPAWRYGLWLLLVVRLMMPSPPQSAFSIFNVAKWEPRLEGASHRTSPPPTSSAPATESTDMVEPTKSAATGPAPQVNLWEAGGAVNPPSASESIQTVAKSEGRLDWFKVALWVWLSGVCFFGARLFWTNLRFCSQLRGYASVSERGVLELFDDCRVALGITKVVTLIETEEVKTPGVYGWWQKRLLLPDGALERFSAEEIRHIFLHELAHLKRRDLEVNWLVSVLQVLHWFNPALWFAFARMRADRELATDSLALSRTHQDEKTSYGETILKVLEGLPRQPRPPGLVGIVESKVRIKQRLIAIARHGATKPFKWTAAFLLIAIGALALTDAEKATQQTADKREEKSSADSKSVGGQKDDGTIAQNRKRFEIRVVDYDTLTPVSGVTVRFDLDFYSKGSRTNEFRTGADGKALTDVETADLKQFAYRVEMPGYIAPRGEWIKHQIAFLPSQFEIKISQGVEIKGTVTDEAGRPLAGAEIFFDRPLNLILGESDHPINSRKWTVRAGERLAVSNASGTWRAKCLYPKIQWASLRVRHPNFADAVYSTEITKAMEAEGKGRALEFEELVQGRARFTLVPGVAVIGSVMDEAGNSMKGIQVRYADRRSENPFWDALMGKGAVTTDAKGNFRIAHLPQKRISFTVQTNGYAPAVAELDLKSSPLEIELRLKKGQKLQGQILDNEGTPVTGARLTFLDWSIWQGVKWETVSDEQGRFQWTDAPAERFRLRIERDGFITQEKNLDGGGEQAIRLNHVLKLAGKVVDARSQKPVERFRICWADSGDRLQQLRRFSMEGSNGVYSVDLGKMYADLWGGGYAHQFLIRIEGEGYLPKTSRTFSSRQGDVGDVSYDIELEAADLIAGTVLDAQGLPAAGAQLALKTPTARLRLAGKPKFENLDSVIFPVTDSKGSFRVSPDPAATYLIAVHERGIAWVEPKAFSTNTLIKLQAWARIEGTVWEYDTPVTNQPVWHSSSLLKTDWSGIQFFMLIGATDDRGRFSFDFVPPGKHRFYRMIPWKHGSSGGPAEVVQANPGEIVSVKIGGVGRPVTGRFKIKNPYVAIDWQKDHHTVRSVPPQPPQNLKTQEESQAWHDRADVQRAYDRIRNHPIHFAEDGSFRIDEMIPGKYLFNIQIYDPRDSDAVAYSRYLASYNGEFEVPVTKEQNSPKPLEIGVFELSLKPQIENGKTPAPAFVASNINGKEFQLADFRGKYVLLDFWATWCAPCIEELPYLREAHKKFGNRNDFVLISLSVDKSIEEAREFVKKNNMPWLQGYLGDWSKTEIPGLYGAEGPPATFLVNPEGKIIAKELLGGSLNSQLEKWLK
jgi:beta-lactamase regulating signal transducer with metallopeptidase domain/peroxiredoxin